MFIRPFGYVLCLLLCVCCLFGLYHLQAQPPQRPPTPAGVSETQSDVGSASPPQSDVQSTRKSSHEETSSDASADFTQTIIDKNLFAPLGTVLNRQPVPGAHLSLVGTFVRENPTHSTALIKNRATGRSETLAIGASIGAFQLTEVQPKQVALDHNGKSVVLHLPRNVLLNIKRR